MHPGITILQLRGSPAVAAAASRGAHAAARALPPTPARPPPPPGLLRSVSRGRALVLPSNHAMQTRFMRTGLYGYRPAVPRAAVNAFRQYVASGVAVRRVSAWAGAWPTAAEAGPWGAAQLGAAQLGAAQLGAAQLGAAQLGVVQRETRVAGVGRACRTLRRGKHCHAWPPPPNRALPHPTPPPPRCPQSTIPARFGCEGEVYLAHQFGRTNDRLRCVNARRARGAARAATAAAGASVAAATPPVEIVDDGPSLQYSVLGTG